MKESCVPGHLCECCTFWVGVVTTTKKVWELQEYLSRSESEPAKVDGEKLAREIHEMMAADASAEPAPKTNETRQEGVQDE